MMEINEIVAKNIAGLLRTNGMKQVELAEKIGVSKQTMSKILAGTRMISIVELKRIAGCFSVSMEDLMSEPVNANEENVVMAFMGKVNTDAAREALKTVDELADLIIFHANVRDNVGAMAETWEI